MNVKIQRSKSSESSIHATMPSDLDGVEATCSKTRSLLKSNCLDGRIFVVELVIREALNNAIIHGNKKRKDKMVDFDFIIGRRWLRIVVSDEGDGFDWRKISHREIPASDKDHGRGIPITREYSKKISFNRRGNRISIWMEKNS